MPVSKHELLIVSAACAVLLTLAAGVAWPGYGQSGAAQLTHGTPPSAAPAQVKPTLHTLPATAAGWTATAQQNLLLRDQLAWVFGGKHQRGWALYVPLISYTLATEADAGTREFAQALARWQQRAGLPPHGTLDSDTLYQFVATWQGQRIKDRSYPPADQLVTVAATEFYDPERPVELRQVERQTYVAYRRMVAAAAADKALGLRANAAGELAASEQFLKIISAFRSREYQEQLRRQDPQAGRAGLAVNSPHFTGRALDLYVGGEPVSTKDANRALQIRTPVYRWLVRNAARFGFRPYYYEPWHWEYCPECAGLGHND